MTKDRKCKFCKPNDPCFACMVQDELDKKTDKPKKQKKIWKNFKKRMDQYH